MKNEEHEEGSTAYEFIKLLQKINHYGAGATANLISEALSKDDIKVLIKRLEEDIKE